MQCDEEGMGFHNMLIETWYLLEFWDYLGNGHMA